MLAFTLPSRLAEKLRLELATTAASKDTLSIENPEMSKSKFTVGVNEREPLNVAPPFNVVLISNGKLLSVLPSTLPIETPSAKITESTSPISISNDPEKLPSLTASSTLASVVVTIKSLPLLLIPVIFLSNPTGVSSEIPVIRTSLMSSSSVCELLVRIIAPSALTPFNTDSVVD